ncbi:unnamed protein product [Ectocarpus sp. 12 AP-2014]
MTPDEQKAICCRLSVHCSYELDREKLCSEVENLVDGAELIQTWEARNTVGGSWAFTARIPSSRGHIMVLAFRGTAGALGGPEFREYVPCLVDRYRPLNGDGSGGGGDPNVYSLWIDILDQMWKHPGTPAERDGPTMEETVWEHLISDNEVWITGHSKGGALATTAAARLVLGEEDAAHSPRHAPEKLSNLSVLTINAPMALRQPLAEKYDEKIQPSLLDVTHRRLFNKADGVRNVPPKFPYPDLRHVGTAEEHGQTRESDAVLRALGVAKGLTCVVMGGSVLILGGTGVLVGYIGAQVVATELVALAYGVGAVGAGIGVVGGTIATAGVAGTVRSARGK